MMSGNTLWLDCNGCIDCGTYQNIRNKYNKERSRKDLFKSNKNAEIIQFLKDIDLDHQF